jgi:hypothetical protein
MGIFLTIYGFIAVEAGSAPRVYGESPVDVEQAVLLKAGISVSHGVAEMTYRR